MPQMLRPQFVTMLEEDQQSRILSLINRLIKCLASPEVAVDERHTPKLYSRFLDGLLLKRNQEIAEADKATQGQQAGPPAPPAIDTAGAQQAGPERVMSPTIQVQAPDEEMPQAPASTTYFGSMDGQQQGDAFLMGGQPMFRGDDSYAHSTTASSTIDARTRDTATEYSNEDVLMQGDENWIATMGALDNPAFWTNAMVSISYCIHVEYEWKAKYIEPCSFLALIGPALRNPRGRRLSP